MMSPGLELFMICLFFGSILMIVGGIGYIVIKGLSSKKGEVQLTKPRELTSTLNDSERAILVVSIVGGLFLGLYMAFGPGARSATYVQLVTFLSGRQKDFFLGSILFCSLLSGGIAYCINFAVRLMPAKEKSDSEQELEAAYLKSKESE